MFNFNNVPIIILVDKVVIAIRVAVILVSITFCITHQNKIFAEIIFAIWQSTEVNSTKSSRIYIHVFETSSSKYFALTRCTGSRYTG